jgi:hypothetical protein
MFFWMFHGMPLLAKNSLNTAMARSQDRAVFLWTVVITATVALAVAETNFIATYLAAILILFPPASLSLVGRLFLIAGSIVSFFVGPSILLLAVPIALSLMGWILPAVISAMAISASVFLMPYFQNLPDFIGSNMHTGSMGFLFIPALVAAAVGGPTMALSWLVGLILLPFGSFFILDAAVYGGWVEVEALTDPTLRLIVAIFPIALISIKAPLRYKISNPWNCGFIWLGAVICGVVAAFFIPSRSITSVVFDESHGKWETTLASFEPDSFGRGANYTYSLLADYAGRLTGRFEPFLDEANSLPEKDALFVIKMPTNPLSPEFSDALEAWVKDGGRLLIVADHTDLYNTTQYISPLLSRFGLRIKADAVYDRQGRPNMQTTSISMVLFGRIDADGSLLPWQTGSSLASFPAGAVTLASYGPSFSELGDYSKQNRFGPFAPRPSLRFGEHTAIAAIAVGKGAVSIVMDSTPWSNFSLFKKAYTNIFRGIIHTLSIPDAIFFSGWGGLALILAVLFCAFSRGRGRFVFLAVGLVFGITIGSSTRIGMASFDEPVEGRDYILKVLTGSTAKLEFLKQLVMPGENNFSRIVSSTSKYGLMPSTSPPGEETFHLKNAKKWLLIQPDRKQLPNAEVVFTHLRSGGGLTLLFAPEAARDPLIRKWASELGLILTKSVGLATSEDRRSIEDDLLTRNGPFLLRDIRTVTIPMSTSLLMEHGGDYLMQTYTIRPTEFPRTSGLLNISFSSDQFSDDAVGEVWEGIEPSSLGRHRERQLSMVLAEKDMPYPFPSNLKTAAPNLVGPMLQSFAVLQDGRQLFKGTFSGVNLSNSSSVFIPSEGASTYLADLMRRTLAFVTSHCPMEEGVTSCEDRFLAPDMIEWMVSWKAGENGEIIGLELLHERRFSGLGSTWNIVFGS